MATSISRVLILVILSFITIFSTCKKGGLCGDNNTYTFENNYATASPNNDSVLIGDTIWIEINIPSKLRDINTNQIVDFSNAVSIGNSFGVGEFIGGSISDPGTIGAVNNFSYITIKGHLINDNILNERIQFSFNKINDSFYLKVGVIPKITGAYYVGISDDAGVYRKNDVCTKATFDFQFANTNQHLYLYQNNRPGYIISDYEKAHLYCFKVY